MEGGGRTEEGGEGGWRAIELTMRIDLFFYL